MNETIVFPKDQIKPVLSSEAAGKKEAVSLVLLSDYLQRRRLTTGRNQRTETSLRRRYPTFSATNHRRRTTH